LGAEPILTTWGGPSAAFDTPKAKHAAEIADGRRGSEVRFSGPVCRHTVADLDAQCRIA
jgi:hypothetical protein